MAKGLRCAALVAVLALVGSGCGGSEATPGGELTIVVNAPFSRTPALGEALARGAELAAAELNSTMPVTIDGRTYRLRVRRLDRRSAFDTL